MSTFKLKHLLAGAAMLAAAAGAVALKPTIRMAEQRPINLEKMIPQQFGDWKLDQSVMPLQVDPEIQAKLDQIYSQVLSRTYINSKGERVMLSIAYGGDQTKESGAHRPEVCYPAQGFQIIDRQRDIINLPIGQISIASLVAKKGERVEPINYWIIVGNRLVSSGSSQKISQIYYGLQGKIPDGMLIRVSNVASHLESSKMLNKKFVSDLFGALPAENQKLFVGIDS